MEYPKNYPIIGFCFLHSLNFGCNNVPLRFPVHHTAYKNNLLKQGMILEARYVRRKDLPQYLPPEQLKDIRNSRKKNDSISSGVESEVCFWLRFSFCQPMWFVFYPTDLMFVSLCCIFSPLDVKGSQRALLISKARRRKLKFVYFSFLDCNEIFIGLFMSWTAFDVEFWPKKTMLKI